jgi:hypothetical protein
VSTPLALPAIAPAVLDTLRRSGFAPSVGWTKDDLVQITPEVVGVRDDYQKSERYSAGENYVVWPASLDETCGSNLALDADGWISFGPFDDEDYYGRRHATFEEGLGWLVRGSMLFVHEALTVADALSADTVRCQQPGDDVESYLAAIVVGWALDRGFQPDPADAHGMDHETAAYQVDVVTGLDGTRRHAKLIGLAPAAVAWLNSTRHAVCGGMHVVLDTDGLRIEQPA